MKLLFIILVFIHGLIHLLGFIKGFDLMTLKAFTGAVSKPLGLLWLFAALLIISYGVMFWAQHPTAWMMGLMAVAVSQGLIFVMWADAKAGTLPNVIILSAIAISLGAVFMYESFTSKVTRDLLENNHADTAVLSEEDIDHLPAAVQKYLHYTLSVGQPKIKNCRAEFSGGMRGAANEQYMQFHSEQYNFYEQPSRFFYMTAFKFGLPATGLHCYENATATFVVKMLNWFKVVDASGAKLNQAETVTVLNDMCFISPATLIDPRISWETVNDTTVKAIFKNEGQQVSALLYFNQEGQLVNFISHDRYHTDGKEYISYPWETPVSEYREINGYRLPSKAKLIYQTPEGKFTYGEMKYESVEYNVTDIKD